VAVVPLAPLSPAFRGKFSSRAQYLISAKHPALAHAPTRLFPCPCSPPSLTGKRDSQRSARPLSSTLVPCFSPVAASCGCVAPPPPTVDANTMEEEDDKQLLIAVCVILGVPLLAALIWYAIKQCKLRRQRLEGPLLQETAQTAVDQKQGAPASKGTARSEDMLPAAVNTRDLEAQLPAQTAASQPHPSAGASTSPQRAHASRQHLPARYMDRRSGRSRMHPSAPMQHGAHARGPAPTSSQQAASRSQQLVSDRGTQPSNIEFSDLSGAEKGANQAIARGGGEPRTRVPISAPVAPGGTAGDGNGSKDKAFTVALVQPDGQRVVLPTKNDSAKPGPLDARFLAQPQVPLPVMSPGAERDAKLREQAHRIDELEQRVDSLLAAGATGQTAGKQIDPPPAETREMPEQLLSSPQLEA